MKKLYTLLTVLMLTASTFAQAPEKMSYQAVVRDASNALVTSTAVGMQLSILQGSISGTAVYAETQTPSTNINGLVSIEIGSGTVVSGTFNTIDWSAGPYFIKTETDPTGGTTYTITGASQLMSVPYALHANTAGSIVGGVSVTETDPLWSASPSFGITNTNITNWDNSFGWGDHSLAGYLTSYTETDPIYGASAASGITGADTTNWNTKQWGVNGNNIYYTAGNVGIGNDNPLSKIHVTDTLTGTNTVSLRMDIVGGNISASNYSGLNVLLDGSNGNNRAVLGGSNGTSLGQNIGVTGYATNGVTNRAVIGSSAASNINTNGYNYGLTGVASNSEFSNIAVGAYATGGATTNGANYGVSAQATSTTTAGTNYGIYALASNGATNYAGYFAGDVTVTGTFVNPSDAKFKKDVKQINSALSTIRLLNPVQYNFKEAFQ